MVALTQSAVTLIYSQVWASLKQKPLVRHALIVGCVGVCITQQVSCSFCLIVSFRKRRGGAHLKEAPDNSDHGEVEGVEEKEEEEERKRARIDDLWASFKQGTGTRSATDTKARC